MRHLETLTAIAVALLGRQVAAGVLIAAGAAESVDGSSDGPAVAADLELQAGALRASARIDRTETVLVGFDFAAIRSRATARWNDACLTTLRAESANTRCWVDAVHREPEVVIEHAIGAAVGVRRDAGRYDAVGALDIHPAADQLADVVELAVTAPIRGRELMYVNHARYSPGWYARAEWKLALLRIGGEVGMTGLESRTDAGVPRVEAYAVATVTVAVTL